MSNAGTRSHSDNDPSRVLTCNYLEKNSSKKDLLRRLRTIFEALRDEDEEIEKDDYPGLGGLADLLVTNTFLKHKDKEVRLYTVLSCVEIFYVFAPEPPFDEQETIAFFGQMVRQLGNLAHCTSPKQQNYLHYFHLLEQLSTVRIGLVLVELCRTMEDNQEPLDSLVELVHTLLGLVHIDHAQEVVNHAASAIASILEEFDATIPTPILDEVLTCIAAGPVVMVTNPAAVEAAAKLSAKLKKGQNSTPEKMPPSQIQQSNPSYLVAANAIRKVGEKVASPISTFLNGLWNGDPLICDYTSISTDGDSTPNVWATIYELHKIAPPILTTVIGNVAASLTAPQEDMRIKVVKLLGRLFYSPNSKIGTQFSPCFREWLRRHVDVSSEVRMTMAKYLVTILANKKIDLMKETSATLARIIETDPDAAVRISAIRQVCDVAYRDSTLVSTSILKAVGNRVSSKSKTERKDALTGLAQIYHKHYITPKLKQVQSGGDDCPIEIIMEALHGESLLEEKYSWIATRVFQCASFIDDLEMRNRVVQIIDEVFIGRDSLSGTSRAVGLGIIVNSLDKSSSAPGWMIKLMQERAKLQIHLCKYLDARSKIRRSKAGTEEELTANADAMECLESITKLIGLDESDLEVLEKLHSARDNHIFKILATISNSNHSMTARTRALEELPKRTKSLGDATMVWVKTFARRTAMSNFVNVETMRHVILLAQECLHEGDYDGCAIFVSTLKSVTDAYPSLFSNKDDFANLLELFTICRSITNPKAKKEIQKLELLTMTSAVVASTSKAFQNGGIDSQIQNHLMKLCTQDGTPEQVRNAVKTMAALLVTKDASRSDQEHAFGPLLKVLTSPTRLTIKGNTSNVICALSALSALAECVPSLFGKTGRGEKARRFALDTVLLGRRDSMDEGDNSDEDEDPTTRDTSKSPNRRRKSNMSPGNKKIVDDDQLAPACRRYCAAIEFLVVYIRSALIKQKVQRVKCEGPSSEHIQQVFRIISQIIEDNGLAQCNRDRQTCKSRQDRAALRECAAIQLFRLCDTRLHLVDRHLSTAMWHRLSSTLLDEEKRVRETLMAELGEMLTGKGAYAIGGSPQPANLRFVAMLVLCIDSEGSAIANGNAANVGKACRTVMSAAKNGIIRLRKTTEATLHQSRSLGRDAEQHFEKVLKKRIMPEYSVPYAIHLLSTRRETPSAGGIVAGVPGATQLAAAETDDESEQNIDDSAQQKTLRKRLKWLYEPLVTSLGDSADNISFLLRMSDMISNQFQPVDPFARSSSLLLPENSDDASESTPLQNIVESSNIALLTAKMKTTCAASREVLLTFVKKDINLTPYPGLVEVPTSLFKKLAFSSTNTPSDEVVNDSISSIAIEATKEIIRSPNARQSFDESLGSISSSSMVENRDFIGHRKIGRKSRTSFSRNSHDSFESASSTSPAQKHSEGKGRRRQSGRNMQRLKPRNSLDSFATVDKKIKGKKRRSELLDISSTNSENSPKKRNTRVTFSPEFQSHSAVGFDSDMSPIKKSESPISFGSSISADTAGTTPPSNLHSIPTPASKSPQVGRRSLTVSLPSTTPPRTKRNSDSKSSHLVPSYTQASLSTEDEEIRSTRSAKRRAKRNDSASRTREPIGRRTRLNRNSKISHSSLRAVNF